MTPHFSNIFRYILECKHRHDYEQARVLSTAVYNNGATRLAGHPAPQSFALGHTAEDNTTVNCTESFDSAWPHFKINFDPGKYFMLLMQSEFKK